MSRSVASTRVSAQLRSASRPKRRISSTKRSSAASASFNSPPSPSTASTIDETRFRSSGCARKAAVSASSLNSKPSIRILLLNQSKPNLPRIALNRTPLGQATLLGDRHRHTQVFRFDSALSPPDVPRPTSHGRRYPTDDRQMAEGGAVEDGLLRRTTEGSPQGGVISPCLSNVFLHYVLDEWFETEVRPRLKGESTLARFADDAIMAFDNIVDAQRVLAVLGKRLARFGLTLHPDKTRLVDFRPQMTEGARHPETDGTSFDFLGLTHVWGRSRNGKNMVRQVTAKSRFARAVAAVSDWCRRHRHESIRDQHRHLSSMMRGHFAYYGVGGNIRRLRWFAHQVVRIWQKWLSRRDRQSVVRWARLNELLKRHPLPPAQIAHGYAAASESLS